MVIGQCLDGFARSRRGNVAMLWGLIGGVLVGLLGIAVDFARAEMIRSRMQNAADGAALVAERSSNLPLADRTDAARGFFDAEMGDYAAEFTISFGVAELVDGGHRVEARMPMPVTLARLVRTEDWNLSVAAEAQASASPPIEVVLALDNTGSMSNDMDTLRDGAQNLVEFLLRIDGETVSVGIVPFVAQVNIGNSAAHLAWMDTAGASPHHGEFFEDRYMGYRNTVAGGCTNAASFPATFGGFTVTWTPGAPGNPAPYTNPGRCYAFAPSQVNLFTVYANLPANAQWGGCIESRPPPYDISDAAPTAAIPATMFVPFFAPDEGGNQTSSNNWITSTTYDRNDVFGLGGAFVPETTNASHVRTTAIYKYRAGVPVSINTGNTTGRGPNRGCPTPILPLTNDEDAAVQAVQNMLHWNGGGTNQIEGLVWAWHAISPTAPFTEGRPYDDPADPVRKVIVLFTDGDNTSLNSGNSALESDYAGLGIRSVWTRFQYATGPVGSPGIPAVWRRPGITNSSSAVNYMNARQLLLCQAIRDANIEIYTIGFRITSGGTADQLLANCATQDGEHYFHADNQQQLLDAFQAIGSGIGDLRLTN